MRMYSVSLVAGVLVGVIYSFLGVRSLALPLVAPVGLLGILAGEQIITVGKHLLAGHSLGVAWQRALSSDHIFGMLPGRHAHEPKIATDFSEERS